MESGFAEGSVLIESINPAMPMSVPEGYLIWLKVWRAPIGYCDEKFFAKLICSMGSMVCVDEETRNKDRCDMARILIVDATPMLEN